MNRWTATRSRCNRTLRLCAVQASEKVEGVPDADVTEDMVKSFGVSLKDSWSKARTISHMQAVQELQDDEQAKKEMALLEERYVTHTVLRGGSHSAVPSRLHSWLSRQP